MISYLHSSKKQDLYIWMFSDGMRACRKDVSDKLGPGCQQHQVPLAMCTSQDQGIRKPQEELRDSPPPSPIQGFLLAYGICWGGRSNERKEETSSRVVDWQHGFFS